MYRCAFYEKEITPPIGDALPGYYDEGRCTTGVLDRLYAKAVVFDDGKKQFAILVIDATEVPEKFRIPITNRIQKLTGIAPERVAVCGTHTHYGIPHGDTHGAKEDEPYMALLCILAADCVLLAQQRLQPCKLLYGMGCVDGISFNRDYLMRDGRVMTNPSKIQFAEAVGPFSGNDPELPVLTVTDMSGKPIGALVNFACHSDCIGPSNRMYSGDFSSILSERLKEQYGQGFVSVFLAGACGDINHVDFFARYNDPNYQRPDYREMGRKLAKEAIRVISQQSECVEDKEIRFATEYVTCRYRRATQKEIHAAEEIINGQSASSHLMLGKLQAELLLEYEEKMRNNGKITDEIPVQILVLGNITLFFMPGEQYHQFGLTLKDSCNDRKCIVATLCNGAHGYFPVSEIIGTDVYAAQLCDGSMWTKEAGYQLSECALQTARKLRCEEP